MARILFLSGWAGFAPLFPNLSKACEFITPFTDPDSPDEKAVFERLDKGGETLLAWSTGAHMALKHGRCLATFRHVLLVAPFLRFTDSFPARVVQAMMDQLDRDPAGLLHNFYTNCGLAESAMPIPRHPDQHPPIGALKNGLQYLLDSTAAPALPQGTDITLVMPQNDKIVRARAARSVVQTLDGTALKQVPGGHCLSEETLHALLHEKTGTPVF